MVSWTNPTVGGDVNTWGAELNVILGQVQDSINLPIVGAITYNPDGSVATDENGVTYAYNADGTVHTATKGSTTRTFTYNADGTIASVA